jgi:hypothetical protein
LRSTASGRSSSATARLPGRPGLSSSPRGRTTRATGSSARSRLASKQRLLRRVHPDAPQQPLRARQARGLFGRFDPGTPGEPHTSRGRRPDCLLRSACGDPEQRRRLEDRARRTEFSAPTAPKAARNRQHGKGSSRRRPATLSRPSDRAATDDATQHGKEGSTVRVRQRASLKTLHMAFCVV